MSKASSKYRWSIKKHWGSTYTSKEYRKIKRIFRRSRQENRKREKDSKSRYNNYVKYRDMEAYRKGWWQQLPIGYKEEQDNKKK